MNIDYNRAMSPTDSPNFRILPLDRRHNEAMLEILQQSPIEAGGLTICFDRQPDIFVMAELKYTPPVWLGFFEGEELAGFALLGNHEAYVNGRITPVMHLANCYIRPQSRGRGYLRASVPLFLEARASEASIGYAVVMKGNRAAESLLGDKMDGEPWHLRSKNIAVLAARNIFLSFRRDRKPAFAIRTARLDDIEGMVELLSSEHSNRLFGLVTDRDRFAAGLNTRPGFSIDNYYVVEQGRRLIGVCAAWDTGAFKQNRVVRYGPWLSAVRAGNNLISFFAGTPALPAPGEAFRSIFVTDWAVRDRSVEVMHALLEHVYSAFYGRGYHFMTFGSCADDPMLAATRGFSGTNVASNIALFSLGKRGLEPGAINTSLPFIDIALL
jgi:hypothetical protein